MLVSVTCMSYEDPRRLKSESGCESEIGRLSSCGICPVMMAGTACQVLVLTVVVLRNQCESSASAARFGNSSRSIPRSLSSSDAKGSSSSTTITTGAGLPTSTAGTASSARRRREVDDEVRNRNRKPSGAKAAKASQRCTAGNRA